jgi:hypothetical protein
MLGADLAVSGALVVASGATISGFLHVSGDSALAGSLTVCGPASVHGKLTASAILMTGELQTGGGAGSPGAAGTFLVSAGAGAPPIWQAAAPGPLAGYTSTFTALGVSTPTAPATVSGVAIGNSAGAALTTTGYNNVIVGPFAAPALTTGHDNVVIGAGAMPYSVSGYANVIIGSQAASAAGWTGSGCIIIGTSAASINAAGAGQIILGDINSALYIQGSLNYRWGATITGSITLFAPIAQLYLVGDATQPAPIVITLPSVAYAHSIGAMVTFRRTGSNPKTVNFQVVSDETLYPDHSTTAQGGHPIVFNTSQMQTQFICNGAAWYQIFTTN